MFFGGLSCRYSKRKISGTGAGTVATAKFLRSLSVRITRQSSNVMPGPVQIRKLSFRLYVIT